MAARNQFHIEGLDDLIKDLAKFGTEALKAVKPDVNTAGDFLLGKTREKLASVTKGTSTGNLSRSLHLKRSVSGKKFVTSNTLTWGNDARAYGAPLELGHKLVMFGKPTNQTVAARPFLRPAADESREQVYNIIQAGMDKALKKLGGK